MTNKDLIENIGFSVTVMGTILYNDFIESYNKSNDEYGILTKYESFIAAFFLFDLNLADKNAPNDLRYNLLVKCIDYFKQDFIDLDNAGLEMLDVARHRVMAYTKIVTSDNWQQRFHSYLDAVLNGTKNLNRVENAYPLNQEGSLIPNLVFIEAVIRNQFRIARITEELLQGKSPSEAAKVIRNLEDNHKNNSSKKKGCYIATMAYGSYDSPEVKVLRNFRDSVLSRNVFGRAFIEIYYSTSPFVVNILKNSPAANKLIRRGLDKLVSYLSAEK